MGGAVRRARQPWQAAREERQAAAGRRWRRQGSPPRTSGGKTDAERVAARDAAHAECRLEQTIPSLNIKAAGGEARSSPSDEPCGWRAACRQGCRLFMRAENTAEGRAGLG